jgi:hypothetical protein
VVVVGQHRAVGIAVRGGQSLRKPTVKAVLHAA